MCSLRLPIPSSSLSPFSIGSGGVLGRSVGLRSSNRLFSNGFESSARDSTSLPSDTKNLYRFVDELGEKDKRRLVHILAKDLSLKRVMDDAKSKAEEFENMELKLGVLYQLAFFHALPFVGFGFLDNLIMIMAGEYIDHTLGITLGISTMAAAGLGNALSDAFGVGSAWYVEHWVTRLGVKAPSMSTQQAESTRARIAANIGRALGVVIGCIIGMFPLIFIDTEVKPKHK